MLQLANGFVDTFELLSGVLAKAGEKLRKVERLADLFPEATTMKSILYDVYAKIIEIIATVIAFFNRKGNTIPRLSSSKLMLNCRFL